jgi:hypothetical protein
MADTKISALTAAGAAALANELAINEAGTSKKVTVQQILDAADVLAGAAALASANSFAVIQSGVAKEATLTNLLTWLQQVAFGMPRVVSLTGSAHSVSSTTGTKVSMDMALEIGTYVFRYSLIIRQATSTSDAPQFGINFNGGTATTKNFVLSWPDASTALTASTGIMDNVGIKTAGFMDAMAHNAVSTTAPNMGTTVGVAATGADHLCWIDGLVIVTGATTMELWHAAEGANASTVEIGSSLVVMRTV